MENAPFEDVFLYFLLRRISLPEWKHDFLMWHLKIGFGSDIWFWVLIEFWVFFVTQAFAKCCEVFCSLYIIKRLLLTKTSTLWTFECTECQVYFWIHPPFPQPLHWHSSRWDAGFGSWAHAHGSRQGAWRRCAGRKNQWGWMTFGDRWMTTWRFFWFVSDVLDDHTKFFFVKKLNIWGLFFVHWMLHLAMPASLSFWQ